MTQEFVLDLEHKSCIRSLTRGADLSSEKQKENMMNTVNILRDDIREMMALYSGQNKKLFLTLYYDFEVLENKENGNESK